MASLNKIMLIGNAGRDSEMRTFPNGGQVTNVTIATTENWKDKTTGEKMEATEWHRLVFNGKLAEIAAQYIKKGTQIYVEGSLKTRKYTDQAGAEKQITEVRVDQMKLLGGRPDGAAAAPAQSRAPAAAPRPQAQRGGGGGFSDLDDDIPFAPVSSRLY